MLYLQYLGTLFFVKNQAPKLPILLFRYLPTRRSTTYFWRQALLGKARSPYPTFAKYVYFAALTFATRLPMKISFLTPDLENLLLQKPYLPYSIVLESKTTNQKPPYVPGSIYD